MKVGLVFLVVLGAGMGQESRGVIAGRVSDPSDASMAGVDLRVTNVETNIVTRAESGATGGYRLPFLAPGVYRLTA